MGLQSRARGFLLPFFAFESVAGVLQDVSRRRLLYVRLKSVSSIAVLQGCATSQMALGNIKAYKHSYKNTAERFGLPLALIGVSDLALFFSRLTNLAAQMRQGATDIMFLVLGRISAQQPDSNPDVQGAGDGDIRDHH